MSLDVEINSNGYSLVGDKSNTKVTTRPVQQFIQPIRQTGRTRPEDTAQYESFVIPNLMNGFGRNKISSDKAFDPEEYKRFWNSTSETRFETIYLPLLSTTATHTGLERIRASVEFKRTLFALFEDTTGHEISCAKFDSDDDPQWEEAGEVVNLHAHSGYITASATASATTGTTETVAIATAGEDRYLLLFVGTRKTGSHVTTDSATYNGVSMSKLRTAGTDGTDDNIVTIFGLADPATGTNTATVTYSAAINAGSSGLTTVIAVALNNVSSVVTGAEGQSDSNATSTSHTMGVTIGDVGFDMAFLSTGTPAAGSGGTSIIAGTQARATRNYSPDTSLVQSQTFSSASYAHAVETVRFKGGLMPLDLFVSGPNLVALYLANDEFHVSVSTDGATWTASSTGQIGTSHVLLDSVTAGEAIDAGKLIEIAGELVAALWDETNSKIVFFKSTDNGDNWSVENDAAGAAVNIYSTSGVKGLAIMPGTDGEYKLYIGTDSGLWECDTAPTNWKITQVDKMSGSSENCRDMIVHGGSLWYPVGADTNTAAGMRKLTNTNNANNIVGGLGLDFGDGVPSDLLGSFKKLVSAGEFLFASVGGSAADRNARILCWNNKGWHHIARSATANREIQWLDISGSDDGSIGTPLLHYNISTGTSTSTSHYIEYPLTNPASGVALKREDHSAGQSGTIDLPFFDLGIPQENKNFLATHVIADDLDSATGADKEYINVDYGLDNAALTTDLGDITSATSKLPFASGAGVSAKNIGLRLNLNRSNTNTGTPKLRDIVVEGYISPETFYEHQMVVDIDQSASETGQSIETVISNLETLINSVAQTSFKFGAVDKFVAVDRERSSFSYGLKTWEAGGPNSLAERSGLCTLTLIEKVAS